MCVLGFLGDRQEGRKIKISKTGKLNIYIAVDMSPSMDAHSIRAAIDISLKLIEKVRKVMFIKCKLAIFCKLAANGNRRNFIWKTVTS